MLRCWQTSPISISFSSLALVLFVSVGCNLDSSERPLSQRERDEILDAIAEAELEAQNTVPPPAEISLPTPAGWVKTDRRPLPPQDNGFTVGYDHESGLAVTLYQFTRGRSSISDDLNAPEVQGEMEQAKNGIKQAVQLGYWQAADETDSGIVQLGDSEKRALWSKFDLTVEGTKQASEVYVWSHANTYFKIRCTSHLDDYDGMKTAMKPLMTAFGKSQQ